MAIALALPIVPAFAQSSQEKAPGSSSSVEKAPTPKSDKKPDLSGATRVSTDGAAASVAKEKAKHTASDSKATTEANDDAILEFKPSSPDSVAAGTEAVQGGTKKSASKDVHGTIYGATDATSIRNRSTGGSVGASSKSKKTSVYVETDHTQATSPH